MKTILFSILTLAALASCSKSETGSEGNNSALVPIHLGAGVETATKAPVSGSATVQIEGWENQGVADYSVASTWKSDASVSVSATAAAITLNPQQYYSADENTSTFIKGWYPKVASVTGIVTFPNDNGTEDVLLSNAVAGNKKMTIASNMTFAHQTAQLIFKVAKGNGLAAGTKIKSITVKNAKVPTGITLATDAVICTDQGVLAVPNITVAEIGTTAAQAGDPLMIEEVANNTTLKLDIETTLNGTDVAAAYTDITFTTEGGKLAKGTAYIVTLTFQQSTIAAKAMITDWVPAAGSGTVQ